jgi:hypothetical protein
MYHCPNTTGWCQDEKRFVSLHTFFRHLERESCAVLNLRTVHHVITGLALPQDDTAKGDILRQVLAFLKS